MLQSSTRGFVGTGVDKRVARTSLRVDAFPDLAALTDRELKELIKKLINEEEGTSPNRRGRHREIDIARAELVNRLRKRDEGGQDVRGSGDDVGGSGSSGVREPRRPKPQPGADGVSL